MVKLFMPVLLLILTGCAAVPADPEVATPLCESTRECDVKWRFAEQWIEHRAGRRVVEKTDNWMRTNMEPSPGNYLLIQVEKIPVDSGEYRIDATMYCAKRVGCDPSPWEATREFNRYVNNAWKPVRSPDNDQ